MKLLISGYALLALTLSTQAAPEMMRAAVMVGGGVEIRQVPVPEPSPGQVRVKIHAASVNPADWKYASATDDGSQIAGRDFSGVIDAIAKDVTDWQVGDAVTGITRSGSYADYTLASVNAIAKKPDNISFEEAAGLGVAAETAWRAIVTVGGITSGQKTLIHGGAGGVGSSAVQIAVAQGAHVIATASPRNHDYLKDLGAVEVIDYNSARFEDVVSDLDHVLNTANPETTDRSMGIVKKGGILISIVGAAPQEACNKASIRCAETGRASGENLKHIVDLIEAGKYEVSIEAVLPLDEANQAWDMNKTRHTRGKIILKIID